ncbi:exodeoxyribonuclease-3 [Cyclonatronum proteinivorum]|uniref:Exodeoxyribonuclease-3 n=1 Tax=Cyclonatronum proteinivorum TaxID=1457365 RepID=A0A345UGN8_9BACT|nr:exodeoxyribonuclease III [Cyclonatronum proteinivorum]AXI99639.1 exodeoxyribonuclease-3 [Cyclonatronum proteinivorum]
MPQLKISTYNVNGIRAAEKKGFSDWVKASQPDIICLQETKAQPDQIPDEIHALGYHASWHSAEKKGYSGVGILSRTEPIEVKTGIGIDWIDSEGRVLMHEYPDCRVLSLYLPSGTTGDVRQEVKMRFLDVLNGFGRELLADAKPLVLCGDYNIAHTEIDIHDPVRNKNTSGFLPEERAWFTDFLELGYRDIFRELNPDLTDTYSWWSYRAASKSRNKGWRLDYQLGNEAMFNAAKSAEIEFSQDMSDHAPVSVVYEF